MFSPELRKNGIVIAALVVPVLAVKAATLVLGQPSLQQASAAPQPANAESATASPIIKPKALTPQQIAAMKHAQSLRGQAFGPAPIRPEHAAMTTSQPIAVETEVHTEQPATMAAVPKLTLTAVMSTNGITSGSDGSVSVQPVRRALINGRPYREGQIVKGTTWNIATIDCDKRAVTLRDTQSDRTVTVNVELPQ